MRQAVVGGSRQAVVTTKTLHMGFMQAKNPCCWESLGGMHAPSMAAGLTPSMQPMDPPPAPPSSSAAPTPAHTHLQRLVHLAPRPTPTCSVLYTLRLSSSTSCMAMSLTQKGRRRATYSRARDSGKPSECQDMMQSQTGHWDTGSLKMTWGGGELACVCVGGACVGGRGGGANQKQVGGGPRRWPPATSSPSQPPTQPPGHAPTHPRAATTSS